MIRRNTNAIALSMVALTIGLVCTQQDVQAKSKHYSRTIAATQNGKANDQTRVLIAKKNKSVRALKEAAAADQKKSAASNLIAPAAKGDVDAKSVSADVASEAKKDESAAPVEEKPVASVEVTKEPASTQATVAAPAAVVAAPAAAVNATPATVATPPSAKGPQLAPIGTARLVGDVQPIDTAMLSVLRDFSKSIKDSSTISQPLNAVQRAAVGVSLAAIDAAVANAQNHPNRIVVSDDKSKYEKSLSAQAWESGLIELANGGRASLNVLWGKKVDGLVNISIAGNCGCKPIGNSPTIGEFVVVINGRSTLDSGFDIQSQTNVHYWLGKVNGLNVDATACPDGQASGKNSVATLKALFTDDHDQRVTLGLLRAEKPVPAMTGSGELLKKSISTAGAPVATGADTTSESEIDRIAESLRTEDLGQPDGNPSLPEMRQDAAAGKVTTETHGEIIQAQPRLDAEAVAKAAPKPANEAPLTESSADKKSAANSAKPTLGSHIVVPDRALAGEYVTVSVLNLQSKPEASVQLSFNGQVANTNLSGRASFQVPEDAVPGPTLHVTLVAQPDSAHAVQVLQPLLRPQSPSLPKIDKVAVSGNTITIDGHSFDGLAERNSVVLDGTIDARVIVSSPVQVKALVDGILTSGPHSVVLTSNGMRSHPEQCDVMVASAHSIARKPDSKRPTSKRRVR